MLKNFKVGLRLGIGFFLVFLLLTTVTLFGINRMDYLSNLTSKVYKHPLAVSNAVLRIDGNIIRIHHTMHDIVLAKNHTVIETDSRIMNGLEKKVNSDFEIIAERFLGDKKLYEDALELFTSWKPIRDEVIALIQADQKDKAAEITKGKGAMHLQKIENAMKALNNFARNKASSFLNDAQNTRKRSLNSMYILLVSAIILGVLFAVFFTLSITRPLSILKKAMIEMGKGKLGSSLNIGTNDEIGQLAKTFNKMNEELIKKRTAELTKGNEQLKKEISDRKLVEKKLHHKTELIQLMQDIAITANEASTVEEAMKIALDKICSYTKWPVGHVYVKGKDNDKLIPSKLWHLENPQLFETFQKITEKTSLDIGVGLPGRVLATGKPEWIIDINKDPNFPRVKLAENINIKAGFAMPVLEGKKVVAVLEFFSREAKIPDEDLLQAISNLATQIGRVTERKRMEEENERFQTQIHHAQRMESIGVLAGGIAHDFNNLMTGILGNISMVKMDLKPEDMAYKRLKKAETASMRAKDLTQQLRTFSKGGEPIKETVHIDELIKDSTNFALSGSKVKPVFFIREDIWSVNIDKGQISQVIHNLVINANEAMKEGGSIKIYAENLTLGAENLYFLKEGKYIRISIVDQGMGIPEKHLSKIFDPYFTTKNDGSGLGLATCYSIIKKHDGLISVESKPEIETTFYIYLPACPGKTLKKKGDEELLDYGRGNILIMDDEEDVREVLSNMLIILGYDVVSSKDGIEAIKLFEKARESGQPFDAAILDLIVQGSMGGEKAIKKMLEIYPDIKAIVSSGYSGDKVISDFKKSGFISVLTKPYTIHDLSRVMSKALKG